VKAAWAPTQVLFLPRSALGRAFFLSALIHLFGFGTIELGARRGWWEASFTTPSAKLRERLAARAAQRERQIPVVFVDVAAEQASAEPPPDTPYYSSVNSRAANPDTSPAGEQPKLEGAQQKVLKTADTLVPDSPASPALKPAPLKPAPPPETEKTPAFETGPTPQLAMQTETKPREPSPGKAEPLPAPPRPGDLMLASARPTTSSNSINPFAEYAARPPRKRPRTLAEALGSQPAPGSSSALIGRKMRQEGGVRRFSIQASLDVQASPLGDYDRKFIAAVQQCWYALLQEQRYSLDRVGRVVLEFRLTKDGRITNMRVAESNVGELYTTICQLAITKPAPYEPWPPEIRRLIGQDYRDVRFTFYY